MEKDIEGQIAATNNLYERIITENCFKVHVQNTMQMVRDLRGMVLQNLSLLIVFHFPKNLKK